MQLRISVVNHTYRLLTTHVAAVHDMSLPTNNYLSAAKKVCTVKHEEIALVYI